MLRAAGVTDVYYSRGFVAASAALVDAEPVLLRLAGDGGDVFFACLLRRDPDRRRHPLRLRRAGGRRRAPAARGVPGRLRRPGASSAARSPASSSSTRCSATRESPASAGFRSERARRHRRLAARRRRPARRRCTAPSPRRPARAGRRLRGRRRAGAGGPRRVRRASTSRRCAGRARRRSTSSRALLGRAGDRGRGSCASTCAQQGRLLASVLGMGAPPWLHYHLGGAADAARGTGASHLALYSLACWGREQGFETLHLGGGVGGREDSLLEFKLRFAPEGRVGGLDRQGGPRPRRLPPAHRRRGRRLGRVLPRLPRALLSLEPARLTGSRRRRASAKRSSRPRSCTSRRRRKLTLRISSLW